MSIDLTPYPKINAVLNILLPDVQITLGNQFIGMYLYGSLASGCFDRSNDVDFAVVTETELSEPLFSALQVMHARIATIISWCATQLGDSYSPQQALRIYDPVHALYFHIDRGRDEPRNKRSSSMILTSAMPGGRLGDPTLKSLE